MRSVLALAVLGACPSPDEPPAPAPVDTDLVTPPPAPSICEDYGRVVPWNAEGPYGVHRHDLAEEFTVPLTDGTELSLSAAWTGCESWIFVPDSLPIHEAGTASIWSADLQALVAGSAPNAHYVFVSTVSDGSKASRTAMAEQRQAVLDGLRKKEAEWWAARLHVVDQPADKLDSWLGEMMLSEVGRYGFAIDRQQRIRGVGSLADVSRYDANQSWPWENNLAYAAHEVDKFNVEAQLAEQFEATEATEVVLFSGEVVEQLAEATVTLPDAATLSTFDTFEIVVEMRCPDPERAEFDNCGAWDYLAGLTVKEADGSWTELGRFITTYHREARWLLDASSLLPHLLEGGEQTFKWEWAPYWNVQPTSTLLSLRFSNQGKGRRPVSATRLAQGGPFSSTYNDLRAPITVPIPASATRVELVVNVTGHGAGTNSCAEFCNHQHEFTVDGVSTLIEFPEAGNDDGCVDVGIANQATPNQWGTWWFGRGGWCPGQPVLPQIVDLTSQVTPGQDATIEYRGLFQGETPPDGAGDILLESWLVVWE
jgi:hypothetical protein